MSVIEELRVQGTVDENLKKELKSKVTCTEILEENGFEFSGNRCNCPFCPNSSDEKSLVVLESDGVESIFCHRAGCTQRKGDVFTLIGHFYNVKGLAPQAALLGKRCGIDVSTRLKNSNGNKPYTPSQKEIQERESQQVLKKLREIADRHTPTLREREMRYQHRSFRKMPPMAEVKRLLEAEGFSDATLQKVGITKSLLQDPFWKDSTWTAWSEAVNDDYVAAVAPVDAAEPTVIGPQARRSSGWVGIDHVRALSASRGWVGVAVDGPMMARLNEWRGASEHGEFIPQTMFVFPIGKVSSAMVGKSKPKHPATDSLPTNIDCILLTVVDKHNVYRHRAYQMGLELSQGIPSLCVGEAKLYDSTEENRTSVSKAVLEAGTMFEWLMNTFTTSEKITRNPELIKKAFGLVISLIENVSVPVYRSEYTRLLEDKIKSLETTYGYSLTEEREKVNEFKEPFTKKMNKKM